MAVVTLTRTWINLAADPSQFVTVDRLAGSQGGRTRTVTGEVRTYANGRLRVVTQAGRPGTIPVTFRTRDQADIDQVWAMAGQPVLVRDPRGRAEYGVYFDVPETDVARGLIEVALTLSRVTFSEEV